MNEKKFHLKAFDRIYVNLKQKKTGSGLTVSFFLYQNNQEVSFTWKTIIRFEVLAKVYLVNVHPSIHPSNHITMTFLRVVG